jgi:hypothetical protein
MQCLEEGFRPAIVLESRASDSAYLASRGIRNLIGGMAAGPIFCSSTAMSRHRENIPKIANSF